MRKVLLLFCIICMLGLAGCQKEEAQVETTKVISQGSNTKEGWWLKRNEKTSAAGIFHRMWICPNMTHTLWIRRRKIRK